jgi:hypothetical protein
MLQVRGLLATGVGVGFGVGLTVGLAVAVGVAVGVTVGVAEGVGVGVTAAAGCNPPSTSAAAAIEAKSLNGETVIHSNLSAKERFAPQAEVLCLARLARCALALQRFRPLHLRRAQPIPVWVSHSLNSSRR